MKKFEMSPFLWGIVATAIVLPLVSFSAGWIVTTGYYNEKADKRAAQAVVTRLADICLAQVTKGSERDTHMAELKAAAYLEKGSYVASKGWATMPGQAAPDAAVAKECAERLLSGS